MDRTCTYVITSPVSVASSETAGLMGTTNLPHRRLSAGVVQHFNSVPWLPNVGVTDSHVFRDWAGRLMEQTRHRKNRSGRDHGREHMLSYGKHGLCLPDIAIFQREPETCLFLWNYLIFKMSARFFSFHFVWFIKHWRILSEDVGTLLPLLMGINRCKQFGNI